MRLYLWDLIICNMWKDLNGWISDIDGVMVIIYFNVF